MTAAPSIRKRSRWVSAAIVVAVMALAIFTFVSAVGNLSTGRAPWFVSALGVADPIGPVRFVDDVLVESPTRLRALELQRDALASIRSQAINPEAFRTLAFSKDVLGDPAGAARLMTFSHQLSRRDLLTQIWLIEQKVRSGDLPGALHHYDVALSVSTDSAELLFPILAEALTDDRIRRAFVSKFKEDPDWLAPFVGFFLEKRSDPQTLFNMVARAGGMPRQKAFAPFESWLLSRLANEGWPDAARIYYRSLAGARLDIVNRASFDADDVSPRFAPLTWDLAESADYGASIEQQEHANVMRLAAQPGERAIVARKLFFLPSGTRSLKIVYRGDSGGGAAMVSMMCLKRNGATEFMRQSLNVSQGRHVLETALPVPVGCLAQRLQMEIAGDAVGRASDMVVEKIDLV